jgi:hypothetical protein
VRGLDPFIERLLPRLAVAHPIEPLFAAAPSATALPTKLLKDALPGGI